MSSQCSTFMVIKTWGPLTSFESPHCSFFGPSPYSTDFIRIGFHCILWVNWCVIYSLTVLNRCPAVCVRIYTGKMGLLKILNLRLDSADVKIGSQHSTILVVPSLLFFYFSPKLFWNVFLLVQKLTLFYLAMFYIHKALETGAFCSY